VAAAVAGHGIAQLPDFMVREELKRGDLVPLLTEWSADTIPLYIVYPPNRHLSNKVRVFVDWLVRLLADVPAPAQS
jgi:DNA-binding transcriptional LysR family regulator